MQKKDPTQKEQDDQTNSLGLRLHLVCNTTCRCCCKIPNVYVFVTLQFFQIGQNLLLYNVLTPG